LESSLAKVDHILISKRVDGTGARR
jgi:hypothetical protein